MTEEVINNEISPEAGVEEGAVAALNNAVPNETATVEIQLSEEQHPGIVEAVLFASGEAVEFDRLLAITRLNEDQLRAALDILSVRSNADSSGFELVKVGGKYQFRTKAIYASFLRELRAEPPRKLSGASLETLAVIAYRQPVVRSDIEKIRGVDCTPTLKTLLDRGLVKILGHQASVGAPALYGTTDLFLSLFGLDSLSQLPTLRDIQEIDRDPGESGEDAAAESHESETDTAVTESAPAN